jgi:hypothetical protein
MMTLLMASVSSSALSIILNPTLVTAARRYVVIKPQTGLTRVSGTNYNTGVIANSGGLNFGRVGVWSVNPATAAAWTVAEVEAAEFGVSS